jgi:hypothetical protein
MSVVRLGRIPSISVQPISDEFGSRDPGTLCTMVHVVVRDMYDDARRLLRPALSSRLIHSPKSLASPVVEHAKATPNLHTVIRHLIRDVTSGLSNAGALCAVRNATRRSHAQDVC